VQLVAFFEFWATSLVDGAATSLDFIERGVPAEVRATPGFVELSDVDADGEIDTATAAVVAHSVFDPLISDPQLGPTIDAALADYDDSRQMVDIILALGLVASVLLIISTVEFEGKVGGLTFRKTKADAETLKAIIGVLFGVMGTSRWTNGPCPYGDSGAPDLSMGEGVGGGVFERMRKSGPSGSEATVSMGAALPAGPDSG
jgi:hypothetical protein